MARTKQTARTSTEGKAPRKVGSKTAAKKPATKKTATKKPTAKKTATKKAPAKKSVKKVASADEPAKKRGRPKGEPKVKVCDDFDVESIYAMNLKTKEMELLEHVTEVYKIKTKKDNYRYRLVGTSAGGSILNRPVKEECVASILSHYGLSKPLEKVSKPKGKSKPKKSCAEIARDAKKRCDAKRGGEEESEEEGDLYWVEEK